MKKENIKIIKWKRGDNKNPKEIQRIIRDYFKNLHSNKLENLEGMDKFQETFDHPKFNIKILTT
jgi:hypothetical protein